MRKSFLKACAFVVVAVICARADAGASQWPSVVLISENFMTTVDCFPTFTLEGDPVYECGFLTNADGAIYNIFAVSDDQFRAAAGMADGGVDIESQIEVWIQWLGEWLRDIRVRCLMRDLNMNCPARGSQGIHFRIGQNMQGQMQGEEAPLRLLPND